MSSRDPSVKVTAAQLYFDTCNKLINKIIDDNKVIRESFFGRIIGFICGDYSQKETAKIVNLLGASLKDIHTSYVKNSKYTIKYNETLIKMKEYVTERSEELDPDFVELCTAIGEDALAATKKVSKKGQLKGKKAKEQITEKREYGKLIDVTSKYRFFVKKFFNKKGLPGEKKDERYLHRDQYSPSRKDGLYKTVELYWGNAFEPPSKGERHANNIPGNKDCRGALIGSKMPGGYAKINTENLDKLENINQKFDMDFEAQMQLKFLEDKDAPRELGPKDRLNIKDSHGNVISFGPPPDAREKACKENTGTLHKDMKSYLKTSFDTLKIFLIEVALEQQDKKEAALKQQVEDATGKVSLHELSVTQIVAQAGEMVDVPLDQEDEIEEEKKRTLFLDMPISGTGIFRNKIKDVLQSFKKAMKTADLTLTFDYVLNEIKMLNYKRDNFGIIQKKSIERMKKSNEHEKHKKHFETQENKILMKENLQKEIQDKISSLRKNYELEEIEGKITVDMRAGMQEAALRMITEMEMMLSSLKEPPNAIDVKSWYVNKYTLYLFGKEEEMLLRHEKLTRLLEKKFSSIKNELTPADLGFDELKIRVFTINTKGGEVLEAYDAWDEVFHTPLKPASNS